MKSLRKKLLDESGQVMVLAVLCLTVLLGFVAFAVDVGMLLHEKRILQTAADSAAIAGAAQLGNAASKPGGGAAHCNTNNDNCWYYAALADALQNGVPNSAVTPHNPPTLGPNKASNAYVEVLISQSEPTFFMRLFNLANISVAARAVATTVPSPNCVYTLGSTGTDIDQTGSGDLTISNCSILDDSSDPTAALKRTGSGSISAKSIGIVGSYSQTGSGSISPNPTTGITAVPDPLSLTAPSYVASSCNAAFSHSGSSSVTIPGPSTPGGTICYDGISNVGSGTITFPAGTYVINGNFSNAGSAGLSGTGVTFYLPPGSNSFSVSGSGTINLSAPTTGMYSGILFYQDPGDIKTMSINGSSSGTFNGIFYAPTAELDLTGSTGATFNTDLVVGSLKITGSVNMSDYAPLAGVSPLSTPRLVE